MQQTKSYWQVVAVAGVLSALIASACTITTSTDVDNGGSGGMGATTTGGSSTATGGSSTATGGSNPQGGSGTAGSATAGSGPVPFQCDPGEGGAQGTPNTCDPDPDMPTDKCAVCVHDKCCDVYAACYATEPGNQCGWGGPATIDGKPNRGGELLCIHECIQKIVADGMIAATDSDFEMCAANCATTLSNGATKECGSVIGLQTSDAVECLRKNCSTPCFGAE